MTHHLRALSRLRAPGVDDSSARQSFADEAPTRIVATTTSTTLAASMMVALRYLEGRPSRPSASTMDAIPDPALS